MLHIHIYSYKAYIQVTLIAFNRLCHQSNLNYKRDKDVNTQESNAELGYVILTFAQ